MRETTLKTLIKTKLSETLKDITWILHGDRDMQSEDCRDLRRLQDKGHPSVKIKLKKNLMTWQKIGMEEGKKSGGQ